MNLDEAAVLSSAIASVGVVINAAEIATKRRRVLDRIFNWELIQTRYYVLMDRPRLARVIDKIFRRSSLLVSLLALSALAAVLYTLMLPTAHALAAICALIVIIVHLLIHFRLMLGGDGADQMQTVLWFGLFLFALTPDVAVRMVASVFVVVQLLLSYVVAGVAKAASPQWRSGVAVASITRTASYGVPGARSFLAIPVVSLIASWGTIAFELGAVGLFFSGMGGVELLIVSGIFFHVSIAFVMGLTAFVWSFLGCYPLMIALATMLHGAA